MKLQSLLPTSGATVVFATVLVMEALCLSINPAKAAFISPDSDFELVNSSPSKGPIAALDTYNAVTEAFTSTATFAGTLNSLPAFGVVARDIDGNFSLSATIDHTGALVGVGTFTLTGQSTTLGISTPTTLLSGLVQGDGTFDSVLQMNGAVTSINPDLQKVVGPIGSAVLEFFGLPVFGFTQSFSEPTASESPEIFLVSVPEPPSPFLFVGGILTVLAFRNRARRRKT
jgi:hypothetical protein